MDARGIFSCKQKNTPSWFAQFIGGISEGDDIPPFFVPFCPKTNPITALQNFCKSSHTKVCSGLAENLRLALSPVLGQKLRVRTQLNTPLGSVFCVFDGYAQRVERITDVIRYGPLFLGFSLGPEFEDHLHEPVYKRGVILQGGIL